MWLAQWWCTWVIKFPVWIIVFRVWKQLVLVQHKIHFQRTWLLCTNLGCLSWCYYLFTAHTFQWMKGHSFSRCLEYYNLLTKVICLWFVPFKSSPNCCECKQKIKHPFSVCSPSYYFPWVWLVFWQVFSISLCSEQRGIYLFPCSGRSLLVFKNQFCMESV